MMMDISTMQKKISQIAASEFKAKCLQLINQVNGTHIAIIITKHSAPIAKLVPIEDVVL